VISTQLDLPFGEWLREPWGGKSPRVLTRGYILLYLRREPLKDDRFFKDPNQLEMFPVAMSVPGSETRVPSLLPFPWEE